MFDEPRYRPLMWAVSLPFLVAVVWAVLILLAQHHRGELMARLADVAVHGNTEEAAVAVRQLSAMPVPPVELLVAVATSPTRSVAVEAQSSINELVRRWYRQVKSGSGHKRVAGQLATLVHALARQQAAFSLADYPWLGRITRRILRLANQFPPEMSLPVTPQCEAILANVEFADASVAAFMTVSPAAPPEPRIAATLAASAPTADDARTPRPFAPHTGALGALGDEASEQPAASDGRSAVTFVLPPPISNRGLEPPVVSPEGRRAPSDEDAAVLSDVDRPPAVDSRLAVSGSRAAPGAESHGWRPRWSQQPTTSPSTTESPIAAANGGPSVHDAFTPVAIAPMDASSASGDAALASLETRALLAHWLAADTTSALELERELARRGFGRLSADLVEQLLSPDAKLRSALVAELLAQPGVDARPWLILLASDQEADVRLAAVSMMATSSDPQLIEEAWQVVLHDRDPRIADLAPRLRARRTNLERR